jgi:signal transduction histidine kinase
MTALEQVSTTPGRRGFYRSLWRGVPRELVFLVLGLPVALAGFIVSIAMFNVGIGTLIPLFVGVFVIIGALYAARGFASVELLRLGWAGAPAIRRVDWVDSRGGGGFWAWLRSVFGNGHYWLALLHTMVVNFAATVVSWAITIVWLVTALGGVTYWFWILFTPSDARGFSVSHWMFTGQGRNSVGAGADILDSVVYFVVGALFLVALPFVTRGLTRMHWGIAVIVLGAWRSEALRTQVAQLSVARDAASSAEGHSLRRLERDIHDGPQQRLVRMQMDLAAADRQLDGDPEKARIMINEAMQHSKDALEELRALSRGFAPPILLDRGLIAALESAAVRSPIATRVTDELEPGMTISEEVQRNAYFAGSEALTNAVKHSGAKQVEIRVRIEGGSLEVTVTDDGHGGAFPRAGHGLAGLDERMRGSGGTLVTESPVGGPTVVRARLPLR